MKWKFLGTTIKEENHKVLRGLYYPSNVVQAIPAIIHTASCLLPESEIVHLSKGSGVRRPGVASSVT